MVVLGVTGNVATGKSTFAKNLTALIKAVGFDADCCAKELLATDPDVKTEVCQQLGAHFYTQEGAPDRNALRELVFQSKKDRVILEKILHPRIRSRRLHTIQEAAAAGNVRFVVAEIPLLYETGGEAEFDFTIVVGCSDNEQMKRLVQVRNLPDGVATAINEAQMPLGEKIVKCDFLVWNDGSPENLHSQTRQIAELLESLA